MKKEEKIQKIIDLKDGIDELIHTRYHELAQKYDLSLEQYHLLIELDELMLDVNDEIQAPTIGQIAKNINNSQNTVSERVTRLENKGLVSRIKDSSDRRISRVVLTDEGRSLINQIDMQASSKFLFYSLSKMKDGDVDQLFHGLGELHKQMALMNEE